MKAQPNPMVETTLHSGERISAKGRRGVDKVIYLLNLLNLVREGHKVTQRDIKKVAPEHCQYIVKAICLRKAKEIK